LPYLGGVAEYLRPFYKYEYSRNQPAPILQQPSPTE
jgi:hypothetical protein